jgi:hypothetical protein
VPASHRRRCQLVSPPKKSSNRAATWTPWDSWCSTTPVYFSSVLRRGGRPNGRSPLVRSGGFAAASSSRPPTERWRTGFWSRPTWSEKGSRTTPSGPSRVAFVSWTRARQLPASSGQFGTFLQFRHR